MTKGFAALTFVGLILGLIYFRTGYNLLWLLTRALIHLQAVQQCSIDAARAATNTFRARYREHTESVIRSL
jgi:hypothetical protein